jgi:hypothetical protein
MVIRWAVIIFDNIRDLAIFNRKIRHEPVVTPFVFIAAVHVVGLADFSQGRFFSLRVDHVYGVRTATGSFVELRMSF